MKKIDLHIHTIQTSSDSYFEFDIEKLKEYIEIRNIDGIAITNHNHFDLHQFELIQSNLDICVLPGIEIDLEGGHVLLISNTDELSDFTAKCLSISAKIRSGNTYLKIADLNQIFTDLSKYILIPHYEKKPNLKHEFISALKPYINAGEVTSPKKFSYCIKDKDSLVPVIFSDLRIEKNISSYPTKQTYIAAEEITFRSIKVCLRDKNKVSLSSESGNKFFDALENGLKLCNGLNVVLGSRSSGKTHTLKEIYKNFENIKYIRQFGLVERDELTDERRFNQLFSEKQSLFTKEYLSELQNTVDSIANIDIDHDIRSIDLYLKSLLSNAYESEKSDSYSKSMLYSESQFSESELKSLKDLINSVSTLIDNKEYRDTIDKYISVENLKKLILELISKFSIEFESNLKKRWVNDLVTTVQKSLQVHTATPIIEDIDLYQIATNLKKVEKFKKVVELSRNERNILQKEFHGFKIVARTLKYQGAGELKALSGTKSAFSDAFQDYNNPYAFLKKLRLISGVEEANYFKFFTKVEYKILNRYGFEVSGGERSEFRLLQALNDAQKFDMLLIDEPESSFDNIFLKTEVNELIKDISKSLPVVLVTHNNTVGASINPDYILYTEKTVHNGSVYYEIYSGYPSDNLLTGLNGGQTKNIDILLNCLEAGEKAYTDRRSSYEILKN